MAQPPAGRLRDSGFTLVEMLVALVILGLITAGAVTIMSATVDNQRVVGVRVGDIGRLQRLRAILKADIGQAAPRAVRGSDGQPALASFYGGDPWGGGGPLLALTRRGVETMGDPARSSLQYVEYALVDGRLERRSRNALDGAPLGPPQILAEEVQAAAVAFLHEGQWEPSWKGAPGLPLPQAVRLDLTLKGEGELSMQFLTSAITP
ncbi:type II secretion system minor pseudopilin GspJ [Caulobacter sp. NIBR2454]|uniref:type II secretion system minor pseudopilin GspJ n=1 Tax=Caulobacter sp. NIBR2454 TaxID=3015996 RepID=UPI0022B745CC|nr:type II secretion system minor pseudopilin GspJ [Caulobacter sp. NIBR2454]